MSMMRHIVLWVAVIAFLAVAMPAGAESVFNQAKSWIGTWDKCCPKDITAKSETAAKPPQDSCKTDVLGNKVPGQTAKQGNIQLGM
jgi:hypothetical protein